MRNFSKDINANFDGGQRGAAVVFALFAMVLIAILAAAFISTGLISGDISLSTRQQTEAYYISEAGLNHAMKLVAEVEASTANYTDLILKAGDGTAGTWDELSTQDSALTPIPLAGIAFGKGRYFVKVTDDPLETDGDLNTDSNQRLVITSRGTGRDGATATTEAIVYSPITPALLVNGPLLISGDPIISGSSGRLHVNGPLTVSGNPCVSGTVTSTSTVFIGGSIRGPNCTGTVTPAANQPFVPVPEYNIHADFKHRADYILGSDGKVTNQAGVLQPMNGNDWMPSGGGKWTWESGNQKWKHGDPAMLPNTTFYAVGNIELGSDFGNAGAPVSATFVAEGSITVSANPYLSAYLEDGKYGFMAGKDLSLGGNPESGFSSTGINYAGDQIKISGNAVINGLIIAANKLDDNSPGGSNPVPRASGAIEISGNARIHYDGGDLIDEKPFVVSWREVRY